MELYFYCSIINSHTFMCANTWDWYALGVYVYMCVYSICVYVYQGFK